MRIQCNAPDIAGPLDGDLGCEITRGDPSACSSDGLQWPGDRAPHQDAQHEAGAHNLYQHDDQHPAEPRLVLLQLSAGGISRRIEVCVLSLEQRAQTIELRLASIGLDAAEWIGLTGRHTRDQRFGVAGAPLLRSCFNRGEIGQQIVVTTQALA